MKTHTPKIHTINIDKLIDPESQHSPLPWAIKETGYNEGFYEILEEDDNGRVLACVGKVDGTDKHNAEFIVTACNCHEELLEALKEYQDGRASDCNDRNCGQCTYCKAKRVIAKAEGK